MLYTIKPNADGINVAMTGQFTFVDNSAFKKIIDQVERQHPQSVIMDFAEVDFIDSAGLGMLLLLRDLCLNKNISLSLKSAQGQVKKIFGISRFDQLFTM